MADKFELPNSLVTRLLKEGAQESLTSTANARNPAQTASGMQAPDGAVIVSKETRHAF